MTEPVRGISHIFDVALTLNGALVSSPPLATGDVKRSLAGGTFANLGTIPAVTPASSSNVTVTVSAVEMANDRVTVTFSDQTSPKAWDDLHIAINPENANEIAKNVAYNNFDFPMYLSSDNHTAATGKTVTGQRSIDGGAFASVTGTISEIGAGQYKINLTAADTNGNTITYKFSAAGCDDTKVTIVTRR